MSRFVGRRRPGPSGIVRRWSAARCITPVNIIVIKRFREERRRRARGSGEEEQGRGGERGEKKGAGFHEGKIGGWGNGVKV